MGIRPHLPENSSWQSTPAWAWRRETGTARLALHSPGTGFVYKPHLRKGLHIRTLGQWGLSKRVKEMAPGKMLACHAASLALIPGCPKYSQE